MRRPAPLNRLSRLSRLTFCAFVVVVLGLGGGVAYAWWSSSGTGSGAASVGTVQSVTVVGATGTVESALVPGASADLMVELDNPNASAVEIVAVSQGTGGVTETGGIGTCDASAVTVPTQSGLDIAVAPGTDVLVHVADGAAMASTAENGCQGATFQIPISLTVQQG